jgi:hypothetical protein
LLRPSGVAPLLDTLLLCSLTFVPLLLPAVLRLLVFLPVLDALALLPLPRVLPLAVVEAAVELVVVVGVPPGPHSGEVG